MGIWHGEAMDSLKFQQAHHALPFYTLRVGQPRNGIMAVSGVACQQGRLLSLWTPHAVRLLVEGVAGKVVYASNTRIRLGRKPKKD
jgi:hypothetical protein